MSRRGNPDDFDSCGHPMLPTGKQRGAAAGVRKGEDAQADNARRRRFGLSASIEVEPGH
jgi:hypothetical protein